MFSFWFFWFSPGQFSYHKKGCTSWAIFGGALSQIGCPANIRRPIQGLSKPGSWGIMTAMTYKNKDQAA